MPRKPRIEYPGAFYHVMCRGNNREFILTEEEKPEYIRTIAKYKERYRFKVYAYCIMDNHVHFLIETGDVPLSKIMQGVQQSFTQYYNKKYNRTGHVFQQRYKALLCDKEKYLWQLIRYIHYNPVEAGLEQGLGYKWSSHNSYISGRNDVLVDVNFVLSMFSANRAIAQREYSNFMNAEFETTVIDEYEAVLEKERVPEHSTECTGEISIEAIINVICNDVGVCLEDIVHKSKQQKYSDVRKAIVRLSVKYANTSNKELANMLNLSPSMISKIISGENRGTYLADELICKFESQLKNFAKGSK